MKKHDRLTVRAYCPFSFVATLVFSSISANVAMAQSEIVRIEEDWELVVAKPDSNSTAPQITCVTSPFSHVNSIHVTFEINHQSFPTYQPGGLSLQLWDGENPLDAHRHQNDLALANSNEVIRWTQVLRLNDGYLIFEINSGTSKTWGNFGGEGYLLTVEKSSMKDLCEYDPAMSVKNSGVGFAANRVTSLKLTEVRKLAKSGHTWKDTNVRVIHAKNDPDNE